MTYSFLVTMYREDDDYEFGIEVKVKDVDFLSSRTPLWVIAAKKASIEAYRLEAVILSIERMKEV